MCGIPREAIDQAIRAGHDTVDAIAHFLDADIGPVCEQVQDMREAGDLRAIPDGNGGFRFAIEE